VGDEGGGRQYGGDKTVGNAGRENGKPLRSQRKRRVEETGKRNITRMRSNRRMK
jgi:hypothetical protein